MSIVSGVVEAKGNIILLGHHKQNNIKMQDSISVASFLHRLLTKTTLHLTGASLTYATKQVPIMFATLIPFVLIGLALADRWLPESQKIRGVNLGSHFIVEPWMAGDTWKKIGCEGLDDEWSCTAKLTQSVANAKFKDHWNTWITQDDIKEIKSYGLNTIRVPVGFWINEDLVDRKQEYYPQGGLYYLDRLVGWAADAGLHVIIDLHGAPGSQSVDEAFTGHVSIPLP